MTMTATQAKGPNERFIGVAGSRARLNTPALLLDVDAMDRNIAAMAAHVKAAGINLRPHAKGGKSIAIARRQVAAGAVGICCTTLGEAEVIAGGGIADVLITSPVTTATMIERLMALNARADGLMITADNPANVDALAAACGKAGKPLGIVVEFDVGQGRTGTISEDAAVALARRIEDSAPLRYAGVQAYYGHFQHIPAHADRKAACEAQMARVRALLARLKGEGLAPGLVTGGGTGTFDIDPAGGVYTEIQPGSYPFMDREYVEIDLAARGPAPFTPSLFVQASVVSASREGFAVVNAGYKSFATEGGMPVVSSPKLAGAAYKLMGDEHGGITYDAKGGGVLKLGDTVEFLTPHCDPTINLYDRYHCVRGDTLVDIWPVDARGC
jgi:D-serine deaminase-like pyridoxal phosphate-dependent protein